MDTPSIWFVDLGIKINELNPIAFNLFGINIYWYGIIIFIGMITGYFVVKKETKRTNQNFDIYSDFLLIGIICGVIGARLYYVIWEWDKYKYNLTQIFNIRKGGIAIYGAVISLFIAAFIYTKVKKINFLKFLDTNILGLVIGQAIGRFGNFVNREAFGGYTDSLFAMRYRISDIKMSDSQALKNVLENTIVYNGVEYIQVHPTFLYESIWNIGLFIILNILKKNKKFDGEIVAVYFALYGIGRFLIEGLRTDQLVIKGTGIAVSQLVSLLLILFSSAFIIFKLKKR